MRNLCVVATDCIGVFTTVVRKRFPTDLDAYLKTLLYMPNSLESTSPNTQLVDSLRYFEVRPQKPMDFHLLLGQWRLLVGTKC